MENKRNNRSGMYHNLVLRNDHAIGVQPTQMDARPAWRPQETDCPKHWCLVTGRQLNLVSH